MEFRKTSKKFSLERSPQQQHIADLKHQHHLLLQMSRQKTLLPKVNSAVFCGPSSGTKSGGKPEGVSSSGESEIDPKVLRNLNPYLKPKRSNSLHNCRKSISRKIQLVSRSTSYDSEDHVYHEIDFTPRPPKKSESVSKKKVPLAHAVPLMSKSQVPKMDETECTPLKKRSNLTYPPYLHTQQQPAVKRRPFTSLILDTFNGFRWDEDPCLLRPLSPGLACPHDPRGSSDDTLDAGSCFVVGPPIESQDQLSSASSVAGNPYSYVEEGGVASPKNIQSQAGMDFDSCGGSIASENIYEEIPEEWELFKAKNRKSLVEEVFDEYEKVRSRRIHSAPAAGMLDGITTGGSIVTLDFSPHDLSTSPDSGLTVSTSGTLSDAIYDDVGLSDTIIRRGSHPGLDTLRSRNQPTSKSIILRGKPPIPTLKRCDTLDAKNFPSKKFLDLRLPSAANKKKHSGNRDTASGNSGAGISDTGILSNKKSDDGNRDGYFRGHLRSSGRGLRTTFDGVKEKIGHGRKFFFNIKKDKRSAAESPGPPDGPGVRETAIVGDACPPLENGGDSSGTVPNGGADESYGTDDPARERNAAKSSPVPGHGRRVNKSAPAKTDGSKQDSKSYFAKSMLPGLSGLHGLSSLRNSAQNFSAKNTSNSTQNSKNNSVSSLNLRSSSEDPAARSPENRLSSGSNPEEITWVPKRLSTHRQLSSSDSWGSDDFESYSSNDEDHPVALRKEDGPRKLSANVDAAASLSGSTSNVAGAGRSERLKDRLLRKREQWRERRQSSGRDIAKGPPSSRRDCGDTKDTPVPVDVSVSRDTKDGSMEDVSVGSGGGDGGKLSRWFSLRKTNNSEAGERKTSNQEGGTPAPQSAGHPLAGGKGTVTSGGKPSVLKEACDESDAMFSASSDCGSQHHRNSSTLSTASFSSSSSSSTTSSLSSLPSTTPSGNTNSQPNNPKLPQLTELEERMSELDAGTNAANFYLHSCGGLGSLGTNTFQRKHQPPNLPPMPPGLTPEQIKRRHIVASIVHSENNYVATLHRLVRDYRKPLEESKPPILSQSKVAILFHYVHELLQCHTLFRIALTDCVRHWDRDEKIGDVFFACFSKSVVLEIYSEFINNFTRAMELAKLESRKKSIFADFLRMRQIDSPDRLSFFGMMVKPVQRFPQFILFLQDLLKHTPKGHPDRMSLQLALTQLESLAETLNELKRESEQHQAFKATLKQINSKFALRSISEGNRCLIRQDDATKLEFGPNGLIKQTKERRLFLTTDAVICVSVVPKTSDDINSHERLSLKWVHPITEIEVQENNSSLTLSRLLAAGLAQRTSGTATSSLGKTTSAGGGGSSVYENIYGSVSTSTLMESEAMVGAICAEMNDLMHDYQVVSRIAGLVSSLKGSYDALSATTTQGVLDVIQQNIQARDDRMSWLDGCCLQIKAGKDVMTFHVQDPGVKKDWIIELRLAQLAVSSVNSPAWDTGDSDTQRPPSRRPLFVTALPLLHASHHTQVVCGCQYPLLEVPKNVPLKSVVAGTRRRRGKTSTSVWICSTDGVTSYVTRYVTHLGGLRECGRASLHELCVTGMLHVPPSLLPLVASSPLTPTSPTGSPHPLLTDRPSPPLSLDTVWIGTLQNRLLVYSGSAHDSQEELNSTELPAAVSSLIYHCHMVFVGLTNGSLLVYHRSPTDGCWLLSTPDTIELSAGAAVSALLPLSAQLYAAVADNVVVVDCASLTVLKRLSAHHGGTVSLLAHSGIGLWLSEEGSSTVCLYHTESCRHLQDIDLAPSVSRMLGVSASSCGVVVTALVISRGLLWVGTSLGVTVTLPLPRLQGVPIISGRPTLSCHAHTGPVTFLMTLMIPEYYTLPRRKAGSVPPESMSSDKEVSWESATSKTTDGDSCSEGAKQVSVKRAHTLPRGFGGTPGTALGEDMGPGVPGDEGAVLGLCGDLLRHWSDEVATEGADEGQENDLRRSDPSLSSMGSTLDRRLRLRDGRPRSLDLSCASIDSKISAVTTTSSGSDDSSTVHTARRGTIKEDCIDSGLTNDRDGAETLEKMTDSCLNTNEVDTEPLECNRNIEANLVDEADHLNKNSVCGEISRSSASDEPSEEKLHPAENNYESTEDSGAIDNIAEALSTNAGSSENRAAGDSTKNAAGDAETLENQVSQLESSDNTIPGCQNDVVVDLREGKSPKTSPGSAKKPKKSVPTASEDGDAKTKSTKGKRSITESLKSVTDAAKSISLTASVEDVTRPKEAQRRTHRRSSSDVTQPVSDALPVNNRPKISLPAGPISSAAPDTQNSNQTRLSPSTSGKDVLNAPYSGTSLNRSLGTLSRSPTARSISKTGGGEPANAEPEQPRTVLVLTGGRGYKCIRDTAPTNGPPHNNTDAHILVWEMKL